MTAELDAPHDPRPTDTATAPSTAPVTACRSRFAHGVRRSGLVAVLVLGAGALYAYDQQYDGPDPAGRPRRARSTCPG